MRSKTLVVMLFVAAVGATLLFRRPYNGEAGGSWTFRRYMDGLADFRDSVSAVLADTLEVRTACVGEGGTLGGLLFKTGVEGSRYLDCCDIFMDSLGWTSVRVGDTLESVYTRGRLSRVLGRPRNGRGCYSIDFDSTGTPVGWGWVPEENYRRLRAVVLEVESTVWESIAGNGVPGDLTPTGRVVTARDSVRRVAYIKNFENNLANKLFVYDIDFYYDVRPGDSIWVLLEEIRYPASNETSFGRIIAAKYVFSLGGMTEALPFFHAAEPPAPSGTVVLLDYYHGNGASLRTMFLKMPVPFGRISSPYSDARMHPVLGYTRVHRGIDYAAPMGTEIYAVGDGVITFRGWSGGYGNIVRIRHANGYETGYGHMSRFARGQEVGTHVRQGDVIGYVGSTGLSTGPHVHFEMKKNGAYVNPSSEIVPPADPLEGEELELFLAQLSVLEEIWNRMTGGNLPMSRGEEVSAEGE